MSWFAAFERKCGWLAFPGLARVVSFCMLTTFGLQGAGIVSMGTWILQGYAVMAGEFWRLVTFLFVPLSANPFCLLMELLILVMVGDALEEIWGSFKLTVYYLCGALFTIAAAVILPEAPFGSGFLNLSLFLAFATLIPDYELLLFFVLPVKVKWLALLSGLTIAWEILVAPLFMKIAAILSIANYLLFFAATGTRTLSTWAGQRANRARLDTYAPAATDARHTCTTCGRTEKSHPELEFRYCTCPGCLPDGKPFCLEHLQEHKQQKGAASTLVAPAGSR